MAESSPEDDVLDLTEELESENTGVDTQNSGLKHFKRPAEDSINQDGKRQKLDSQSLPAVNNSFEDEKANKETQQYEDCIRQLNDTINNLKGQLDSAHQKLKEWRVTNERLEKEKKDLIQSYERQIEESNQEKKRHRKEEKSLTAANNSFEKEQVNKESSIQHHLSDTADDFKGQLASARRQLDDRCVTIESLEKEKKDLTLRLSKLAGANLTYNNPNIADLSDENRPTKLAEDFSELYDNELTDAFESLGSEDEREKTQIMLEILKKSYELCFDTSQDHINRVKDGFATIRIRYKLEELVEPSEEQATANRKQVEAATEMQDSSRKTSFKGSLPTAENRIDGNQKNEVMQEEDFQLQPSEQEATVRQPHQNEQSLQVIPEHCVKESKIEECTEKTILIDVSQSAAEGAVKTKISKPAGDSLETSNKFTEEQSENKPTVHMNLKATEGANEESHVIKSAAAGGDQAEASVTEKQLLTGNKEQHETNVPESKMLEDNNVVTPTKTQVTADDEGNYRKECFKNSLDKVEGDEQKNVTNFHDWKKNEVMLEQPSEQEVTMRLSHQNEQSLPVIPEKRVKKSKIEECTEKTILTDVSQSAAEGAVKTKISKPAGDSLETSNKFPEEQSENKPIVYMKQKATEGANEESHVMKSAATGGDQAEASVTEKLLFTGNKEQHETNVPESKMLDDHYAATPTKTQVTAEDEGNNRKKKNENVRNETKGVQGFHNKTLTAQFDKLTKEQMKTVSDIRKYFESELTESFQKESANVITKSISKDMQNKEFVQKYIQKCLQICWSMCRHEPPVFIHFVKPGTDTLLDTSVFRPYTKSGKYVDYVVWPPLYLYENGPMLLKGIAQGRK